MCRWLLRSPKSFPVVKLWKLCFKRQTGMAFRWLVRTQNIRGKWDGQCLRIVWPSHVRNWSGGHLSSTVVCEWGHPVLTKIWSSRRSKRGSVNCQVRVGEEGLFLFLSGAHDQGRCLVSGESRDMSERSKCTCGYRRIFQKTFCHCQPIFKLYMKTNNRALKEFCTLTWRGKVEVKVSKTVSSNELVKSTNKSPKTDLRW